MPLDPILAQFVPSIQGETPDIPIEVKRAQALTTSQDMVGTAI